MFDVEQIKNPTHKTVSRLKFLNTWIPGYSYLDAMTQLTSEQLTLERLEKAYKISAKLVALYGDTFLPFFERFHDEIALLKKREYT